MSTKLLPMAIFALFAMPSLGWTADCPVCLYTPPETTTISHGKGQSAEVLKQPIFSGEVFYALDSREKKPLPPGKGVYFVIYDGKSHVVNIVGAKGQSWAKINLECADFPTGIKVRYRNDPNHGSGWLTTPHPADPKKCPWNTGE